MEVATNCSPTRTACLESDGRMDDDSIICACIDLPSQPQVKIKTQGFLSRCCSTDVLVYIRTFWRVCDRRHAIPPLTIPLPLLKKYADVTIKLYKDINDVECLMDQSRHSSQSTQFTSGMSRCYSRNLGAIKTKSIGKIHLTNSKSIWRCFYPHKKNITTATLKDQRIFTGKPHIDQ